MCFLVFRILCLWLIINVAVSFVFVGIERICESLVGLDESRFVVARAEWRLSVLTPMYVAASVSVSAMITSKS